MEPSKPGERAMADRAQPSVPAQRKYARRIDCAPPDGGPPPAPPTNPGRAGGGLPVPHEDY